VEWLALGWCSDGFAWEQMCEPKISKDITTTRPKRGIYKNILNCSDKTLGFGFRVSMETKGALGLTGSLLPYPGTEKRRNNIINFK
jgi:hypothetical protein